MGVLRAFCGFLRVFILFSMGFLWVLSGFSKGFLCV